MPRRRSNSLPIPKIEVSIYQSPESKKKDVLKDFIEVPEVRDVSLLTGTHSYPIFTVSRRMFSLPLCRLGHVSESPYVTRKGHDAETSHTRRSSEKTKKRMKMADLKAFVETKLLSKSEKALEKIGQDEPKMLFEQVNDLEITLLLGYIYLHYVFPGKPQEPRYWRRSSDKTSFDQLEDFRSERRRSYETSYKSDQREKYAKLKVGAVDLARTKAVATFISYSFSLFDLRFSSFARRSARFLTVITYRYSDFLTDFATSLLLYFAANGEYPYIVSLDLDCRRARTRVRCVFTRERFYVG